MTLLLLALLGFDARGVGLFESDCRVSIGLEVVPAQTLSLDMTTVGGGAWLVAEWNDSGAIRRFEGWVPSGSRVVGVGSELAVYTSQASDVALARIGE